MKIHFHVRLAILFVGILFLSSTLAKGEEEGQDRGLFVTVFGDPNVYSSGREIRKLIDFSEKSRVKILFVQVYRSNLAWFPSNIGDSSPYKTAVEAVGQDPFALLIRQAHQAGIEVYAWVNLLSLGDNQNAVFLKKYGPDILTRNVKEKKIIEDFQIDGQYFLEPGDLRVRRELSNLTEEILQAYPDLDGLQFDYIRYPDKAPHYGYTAVNVERFKKATGFSEIDDAGKEWQKWKRDQVTELLKELILNARKIRPKIKVSTTGCMPYSRALYEAFQDWPLWVNEGIVDSVTVMDYSTDPKEYDRWIEEIKANVNDFRKVNITVGSYKPDTSVGIFKKEFSTCETSGAGACVVFYYSSLLHKPALSRFMTGNKKIDTRK